jgi:hypothetical protein
MLAEFYCGNCVGGKLENQKNGLEDDIKMGRSDANDSNGGEFLLE